MTKIILNAIVTEHSVRTECSVMHMNKKNQIINNHNSPKISTKERILNASFELSANSSIKAVSLNDIAKKAGIAKPGIFRYYKSKEDLQEKMKDRFFDDFCVFLESLEPQNDLSEKTFKEREKKLLKWFIERNEYLLFFLNTIVESDDFIPTFIHEMQKRSLANASDVKPSFSEVCKTKICKKLYLRTTEIFFLLARAYMLSETHATETEDSLFCTGLIDLVYNGWKNLETISESRMLELESISHLDAENFPPESKMFQALSSLLSNYSFSEITVEKMASELGMAKSSLYTHHKNKEDMIKNLIEEELLLMMKAMNETVSHGKNFSEYVFLHMRSQMEYLSKRTSLVPVCNRLSVQGFLPEKVLKDYFEKMNDDQKKIMETVYPFTNIGFSVDGVVIGGWFFSLCITAFKLGQFFNFSSVEIKSIIRTYYGFMKEGLKNNLTE